MSLQWVRGSDGARLRVASFEPAPVAGVRQASAAGTALLLHGRTEFLEKYTHVIAELRTRGFRVVSLDWPGQGLSDHPLDDWEAGHIDTFDRYIDAVRVCLAATGPHRSLVALSHSMGGVVLLEAALRRLDDFKALAFSAPMWGIRAPAGAGLLAMFRRARGAGQQRFRPQDPPETFAINPVTTFKPQWSRVRALWAAEADLKLGPPTWGWIAAAYEAMNAASRAKRLRALTAPCLIATAGKESIVSNAAQNRAASLLPNAKQVLFPAAKHEILMEQPAFQAQFWDEFDALLTRAGV
jgi:lysophospholipase